MASSLEDALGADHRDIKGAQAGVSVADLCRWAASRLWKNSAMDRKRWLNPRYVYVELTVPIDLAGELNQLLKAGCGLHARLWPQTQAYHTEHRADCLVSDLQQAG
ncbi:hypothetical protein ACVWZW_000304 [Bradyrhizobium sp. F1.13.4]